MVVSKITLNKFMRFNINFLILVIVMLFALGANVTYADTLLSSSYTFAFNNDPNAVIIDVDIYDNYAGDYSMYYWQYTVTNNSYNIREGTNGFSGLYFILPIPIPELAYVTAPNANWDADTSSDLKAEWDIKPRDGYGIMPGEGGVFGFTTDPRTWANSDGWFHSWGVGPEGIYKAGKTVFTGGPEVPNTIVPEPISSILFLTGGSLLAGRTYLRKKRKSS